MKRLNCVHAQSDRASGLVSVGVSISLERNDLLARFEVRAPELYVDPAAPRDQSVWGLWEHDVVELFICPHSVPGEAFLPYYEFQVSPLGQFFELEILEPRRKTNSSFRSGFDHRVERTSEGWNAEMRIPLGALGWSGESEHLFGNAFAILGIPGERSYYSLFIKERQDQPDFHIPERFRPLLGL